MKHAIPTILLTMFLAAGCNQTRMTQFEHGDIRLEAGGRIVRSPALTKADYKPGIYYSLDTQTQQVLIEVKLLETDRRNMSILGVNWCSGSFPLIAASDIQNTTPEKSSPMALGGLVNVGIGGGDRRGGCPHGPGCKDCGSSGGGVGGGINFPVIIGKGAETNENVTSLNVTFDLDMSINIEQSYLAIEILLQKNIDGTLTVQPLLLPITTAPKTDPPTPIKQQPPTTVLIRDDQTILLGGLINETEAEIKQKTPILGDIPMLGRLFKSRSDKSIKRNLLIFVTPRIILSEE
ncbi:MAG: hypothetical protein HN350_06370 [Phycisphaerales bacterium]|jgi:hypothetical protein|nr:hypothetical protein [Phycisphaerales bacterium]